MRNSYLGGLGFVRYQDVSTHERFLRETRVEMDRRRAFVRNYETKRAVGGERLDPVLEFHLGMTKADEKCS